MHLHHLSLAILAARAEPRLSPPHLTQIDLSVLTSIKQTNKQQAADELILQDIFVLF